MLPVYKVVVAEDEARILKNLVVMLQREHPRFQVVGSAGNGREAIALVDSLRPHLLLTDIRMPIADGLDVLRHIHEQRLPTASVIISGFDQFRYAQQALRYGACEYLLKPVSSTQLGQTLQQAETRFLGKDRRVGAFSLDQALAGNTGPLPESHACHCLLLVHSGNYSFARGNAGAVQQLLEVDTLSQGLLRSGEQCWLTHTEQRRYRFALLGCSCPSRARAFAKELFEMLGDGDGQPQSVVFCLVAQTVRLLQTGEQLLELMRNKSVFGRPLLCEWGRAAHGTSFQKLFGDFTAFGETLIKALARKDLPGVKLLLRDMAQDWQACRCPTATILNLVRFLYMQAGKELAAPLCANWELRLSEIFTDAPGWEALCESLFALFEELVPGYEDALCSEDIMQMIDEYIRTHYAQRITNQTLARQYGFVPSYISKLFKDYKGVSPCEYVTQVRLEKARRMIAHAADVNVSSIAGAVGFSDPSYFSRLFKQQTGLLPTEYRDTVRKNRSRADG